MKKVKASDGTTRRGWGLFRPPFHIRDIKDPLGRTYLTRWRLVETPYFGIFLHRITRADWSRALHDHPWPFLSIVLRGGYDEDTYDGWDGGIRRRRAGTWATHKATDAHTIMRLHRVPTWTICLVGPRQRVWGFHDVEQGWVDFETYIAQNDVLPGRRGASSSSVKLNQ